MSRIGKLPIEIPSGVNVSIAEGVVTVKGKLGELTHKVPSEIAVANNDNKIIVSIAMEESKNSIPLWGLTRTLINNMVKGVNEGFRVTLEVTGVGYRAAVKGQILTLFLGYSHEIKYLIPEAIEVKCPKPTTIEISGHNKEKVGQVAANIRKLRLPEPYKGKGVRYDDETIYRKEGKKK